MRFMHVGDTHIGKVYKSDERNNDLKDVFKQVVDSAINSRIDFIVHSGDLFNEGNPSLDSLLFVTDQLNKLREAKIKVFIVPGSHDVGMGEEESIIELFHRNGLLVNLASKNYVKKTDDSFTLKGENYQGAFVCGVQGKRSRVENEVFKKLKIEIDKTAFIKIFIFHHTISALGEQFKDLDMESLPKGFDYYAAGHWHGHRDNIPYDSGVIEYPGSTEYCDEKEIVDNPNRGYYIVEYNEKGIKNITYNLLKTREKEVLNINADGKSAKTLEQEISSKLNVNDGKLLVIRLSGKLSGKVGELNLPDIKKNAFSLGYSYVSINTSKLYDKTEEIVNVEVEDIGKIEFEFLNKKGYNENEINLAKMLIEAVENGENPDTIKTKAEKIFEEYDNKRN
jgi:DNA repair exonuclease SbcCD nuclease subunit